MSLERGRSIPSLDGLRAFSVLAVILGHTQSAIARKIPFYLPGVAVFFVISGFLITHLLLKEQNKTGKIDLKRFYLRRTFRIFPPFYVYIAVVAALGAVHLVQVTRLDILAAGSYTWNYDFFPGSWVLGHCWSLSLEEQFYLLWPFAMAHLRRTTALKISLGIVLASPFIRVADYFLLPASRTHMDMMLHTHLDTIMMGCLLALMLDLQIWRPVIRLALSPLAPTLSLSFLLTVDGLAEARFRGMYRATVGLSLESVAIAALLLFVIFRDESPLGRLLNLKPIKHLGVISYSLYLYQQLFTGPYTRHFPLNICFIVIAAELSYLLIEKPSFRLREFVQKRFILERRSEAVM